MRVVVEVVFLYLLYIFMTGISKLVDCDFDFLRQPRNVELEVCLMGKAISWAATVPEGVESGTKSRQ